MSGLEVTDASGDLSFSQSEIAAVKVDVKVGGTRALLQNSEIALGRLLRNFSLEAWWHCSRWSKVSGARLQ